MRIVALLLGVGLVSLAAFSVHAQDKGSVARPALTIPPGEFVSRGPFPTWVVKEPLTVTLKCATPGAVLRYTLDGTTPPDAEHGLPYTEPIKVDRNTTIVAVAFKEGMMPSPAGVGVYLVGAGARPGLHTLHVGNSLTNTTHWFADQVRTTGALHEYRSLTAGGAWTRQLWDVERDKQKDKWDKMRAELGKVDHFTVQPRDFDIAREASYDIQFFDLVREKSPDVQPWFYCEWVEKDRKRPTDQALVPSSQMKKLYPALTWPESMGAMLLYVEELQATVAKTYQGRKRPRIIPSSIAVGIVCDQIERGSFPDTKAGSFYPLLFQDTVHPNDNGAFLVDCTWYAAFYGESPEGKMLPLGTKLTPAQAKVMQQVAWQVVSNYPESGLYKEGTEPAGKPEFVPAPTAPAAPAAVTTVRLSSATPGALFRYTLDGTTPTHERGYVYAGAISVRPAMTVKAVAFKSGLADSPVAEATYPAK